MIETEHKQYRVPVVRLTTPGIPEDDAKAEVLAEWQGVAHVYPEPIWERRDPTPVDLLTVWPTPYLTGITLELDLSNTTMTRPSALTTLDDAVGVELWMPLVSDGTAEPLDVLAPRQDWDTSTGQWANVRYLSGHVRRYTSWDDRRSMTVSIGRHPGVNELYRIERRNDEAPEG